MMLVTDPQLIGSHAILLASRGCADAARQLISFGHEHGLLDHARHRELQQRVGSFPPAQLPPGHRVFGIFHDSVLSSLHFEQHSDRAYAREAFRQAVRWMEIETSSQCNRRCPYCPNSQTDRVHSNDFLDFDIYLKLISDLAEIDYDGILNFVGNNEFFIHRANRRYVDLAHRFLPKAIIKLYSNGDHLEKSDLEWASSVGVRLIHVTLHPASTKDYDDVEALRRAYLFQKQIGEPLQLLDFVKGGRLQFITRHGNTSVFVKAQDMKQYGHNWAGLVPYGGQAERIDPCSYPIRQFIVSHDADLLMCCMTFKERTEENDRTGAAVGNLTAYPSIFEAYASPGMTAWRRSAFMGELKAAPCRNCQGFDPDEATATPLAAFVREQLALAPV